MVTNGSRRIIFVDIDGTICTQNDEHDYAKAEPLMSRISRINTLFEEGHQITYWTGRGGISGTDHTKLTIKQLKEWGAKYTSLIVGEKPHFDVYICDKSINADRFFTELVT
ncbi:MAG: hypothetical protein HOH07_03300 [Euryarchaeota archaeon]|jgi:hypothetical protein|nr:hypothetical protein [Euryarchaeota archaeon]